MGTILPNKREGWKPSPTVLKKLKWKEISGHVLLELYGMTEIGMGLSNPLHGIRAMWASRSRATRWAKSPSSGSWKYFAQASWWSGCKGYPEKRANIPINRDPYTELMGPIVGAILVIARNKTGRVRNPPLRLLIRKLLIDKFISCRGGLMCPPAFIYAARPGSPARPASARA